MNYDQWKLSNPIDDGYGYSVVSDCCGARMDEDQGLCYQCKDHCEPMEDYEDEAARRAAYEEMMADGAKDES